MKKIVIVLLFLLCFVIGYRFFSNQINLPSKKSITPTQTMCPYLVSQDYYTYSDKNFFESGIKKFEGAIASVSAVLNQTKNSNPTVKYKPISYEEFKGELKRLKPSTDLEKYDSLIKSQYQEYLVNLEAQWNKYVIDFNQTKQSKISAGELAINMANEIIILHKTTLKKLINCEKVSKKEFDEKQIQIYTIYKTLKK